jgi:ferredoxin
MGSPTGVWPRWSDQRRQGDIRYPGASRVASLRKQGSDIGEVNVISHRQSVWVDVERCTGCGACVEICPVGAIALLDGEALVDQETCTGCLACVDVCPEGAVQPLIHGEIVPVQERPILAVQRARPLAETAGVAVAAAGVSVLAQVAGRLAQAVGRWLAQELTGGREVALRPSSLQQGKPLRSASRTGMNTDAAGPASRPSGRGRNGRGRQARRRHRGR